MSQENVDLVTGLLDSFVGVDLGVLLRDDERWAAAVEVLAPMTQPDVEYVFPTLPGNAEGYIGLAGYRDLWRDWIDAWETYRFEVVEAVDCGDRVLLIAPSFGRLPGSAKEVSIDGANVWTVRNGKVARVEFYLNRKDARKAVGLEE